MVESNTSSTDKSPSPELLSLIKAAAQSLLGFGELWGTIKAKGKDEGFSELDLQDMLRPLLRDRLGMNKDKIYYLFHKEEVKARNSERYENMAEAYRKKTTFDESKVIEQTPIPPKEPPKDPPPVEPKEDPLELENEFLKEKVGHLEEALKKTEQFKPATALQSREEDDINTVTLRAGIGAIGNIIRLEIPKLENRGWKVVEVKMRAV